MTNRFNLSDLTAQLAAEATGKPQEAQQQPEPTRSPPQTPQPQEEAPERRTAPATWRTIQTPEGTVPNARTLAREARASAEAWYQALRRWEVVESERVKVYYGPAKSSRMRVVGVGSYGGGGGQSGSYWATVTQVITPVGAVSEARLGGLCSADPLLGRIRGGGGLASLCDPRGGWHPHGEQARAYAVAVLRLAVLLGDERAQSALATVENG